MAKSSPPTSSLSLASPSTDEALPAAEVLGVPDELLPKVLAIVCVSRKTLLKEALVKLCQEYYDEDVHDFDGNLFICRLTIGLPPYALSPQPSNKVFFYVSIRSTEDFIEKACEAALIDMEPNRFMIVYYFNHACKSNLLSASTYADLLQEKANLLEASGCFIH